MIEGEIFMYVFSELKLLTPCVRRCRSIKSVSKECEIFKSARFRGAEGQCEGCFNVTWMLSTNEVPETSCKMFIFAVPPQPSTFPFHLRHESTRANSILAACTRKRYNYRAEWRTVPGTLAAQIVLWCVPDSTVEHHPGRTR